MILCQIFKWSSGHSLDAGKPPSGWLGRHLTSCPDCRRHFESQSRLVSRLKMEAVALDKAAPPFLHGSIMSRINRDRQPEPAGMIARYSIFSAGVAVAALVAVAIHFNGPAGGPTSHAKVSPQVMSAAKLGIPDPAKALALGSKLSSPLEAEAQALAQDARSAVSLLARNFLPEQYQSGRE